MWVLQLVFTLSWDSAETIAAFCAPVVVLQIPRYCLREDSCLPELHQGGDPGSTDPATPSKGFHLPGNRSQLWLTYLVMLCAPKCCLHMYLGQRPLSVSGRFHAILSCRRAKCFPWHGASERNNVISFGVSTSSADHGRPPRQLFMVSSLVRTQIYRLLVPGWSQIKALRLKDSN